MLEGRRILLVEDEYMLARDLALDLREAGATVLGPEPSVERALARIVAEASIDAAVLDVNLGGEPVDPVAEALAARQVPFLFTTGYREDVVRERYPGAIICDKPIDTRLLILELQKMTDPVES